MSSSENLALKIKPYPPAERYILLKCLSEGADWEEALRYLKQNPPEPFEGFPCSDEDYKSFHENGH